MLAGNLPHNERISIDPFALIKGNRIIGTCGGERDPDIDLPRYVDLYLGRKLNLNALNTSTYYLSNINQAFDDLEHDNVPRPLIDMTKQASSPNDD